jgi:hypothetical protein
MGTSRVIHRVLTKSPGQPVELKKLREILEPCWGAGCTSVMSNNTGGHRGDRPWRSTGVDKWRYECGDNIWEILPVHHQQKRMFRISLNGTWYRNDKGDPVQPFETITKAAYVAGIAIQIQSASRSPVPTTTRVLLRPVRILNRPFMPGVQLELEGRVHFTPGGRPVWRILRVKTDDVWSELPDGYYVAQNFLQSDGTEGESGVK